MIIDQGLASSSNYRNGTEEVHGGCGVVVCVHEGVDKVNGGLVHISSVGTHGGLEEVGHCVDHLGGSFAGGKKVQLHSPNSFEWGVMME